MGLRACSFSDDENKGLLSVADNQFMRCAPLRFLGSESAYSLCASFCLSGIDQRPDGSYINNRRPVFLQKLTVHTVCPWSQPTLRFGLTHPALWPSPPLHAHR